MQPTKKEKLLITRKEAAEMLSVSVSTVQSLVETKQLKWVKILQHGNLGYSYNPMHRVVLQSVYDFINK